jgi:hypothetical protein
MSKLENITPLGFTKDGNYLISQKDYFWLQERVEELEKQLRHLQNIHSMLEDTHIKVKSQTEHNFNVNRKLDAENRRYKQALEFYANKEVYQIDFNKMDIPEDVIDMTPDIISDNGETAHKALKGESE